MVKDAHENYEIELFLESSKLPHGHSAELDVHLGDFGGKASLRKIMFVSIDSEHSTGTAAAFRYAGSGGVGFWCVPGTTIVPPFSAVNASMANSTFTDIR